MRHLAWIFAALLALSARPAAAHEVGLLLGGSIDVKDTTDFFVLSPFYSTAKPGLEETGPSFFLPLSIGFATDLPDPTSATAISMTPSIEMNLKMRDRLFISPRAGLDLAYVRGSSGLFLLPDTDTFDLGIALAAQLKVLITKQVVFRFSPIGFRLGPWRYTSNGIGSDATFTLAYTIDGGISYLF